MAKVGRVIHRGAAHVPQHTLAIHGHKGHLGARQAVLDAQREELVEKVER